MAIRTLDPGVVDRIAAGEVLDRPANLVKELVENSIDAGATEIEVDFATGGRDVLVRDNGGGIGESDLPLALRRHATSKISQSEDLFNLHSFGFRGEALASIAAVSRLMLTSRVRGVAQGYRIGSQFGEAEDVVAVSSVEGTEVRIQELFANVPARLKFLKSEGAEHTQIKTTLKALALAHEHVTFKIYLNHDLIYHWPTTDNFAERAQTVLEKRPLFYGTYALDGISAEVLVSSPQDTAQINRSLWFFVQRRWIQDRSLTAAVMEAYRNLLMHGEYPTVVVRLSAPPEDVDVNVHPTKAQVKFRDGQTAFRATCRAVRQVLETSPWLSHNSGRPALTEHMAQSLQTPQVMGSPADRSTPWALAPPPEEQRSLTFQDREFSRTQYATKSFLIGEVRDAVGVYGPNPPSAPGPAGAEFRWADLQVIGQFNQTYIVAQTKDALYLVDQHAAHERVVFERLMEGFRAGNVEVQNLLIPLVFELSAEEIQILDRHRAQVEKLGLSVEAMGPESLAVQAIPSIVKESAVVEALQKMAFELSENTGELAWEKAVAEIFASMACHSVVRAGQSLSSEEMQSLLRQMDLYPLSSFCPHGRPVFSKRRVLDIDREFGRIP